MLHTKMRSTYHTWLKVRTRFFISMYVPYKIRHFSEQNGVRRFIRIPPINMWAPFQVSLLLFSHESRTSIENQFISTYGSAIFKSMYRANFSSQVTHPFQQFNSWRMTISVLLVLILLIVSTASAVEEGMKYFTNTKL